MKKIYCTPATLVTTIHTQHLIAQSLLMGSGEGKQVTDVTDVLVKENRTYRDYNVWDDDWSN